jgi:type II secretory pathway component PulL
MTWQKAWAQLRQIGAGQPGVSAISISALPTCQGGLVHGVSDAQSRWRLSWVASRPCVWPAGQGLVNYYLKSMVELTHSTYKYPPYPLGRDGDQKVRFSFL